MSLANLHRTYKGRRDGILMACTDVSLRPPFRWTWRCGVCTFVCLKHWHETPQMIQAVCKQAFKTTRASHLYFDVIRQYFTSMPTLAKWLEGNVQFMRLGAKKTHCRLPTLISRNCLLGHTQWPMRWAQEIFARARYAPEKSHWWRFLDSLYRLVRISSATFCRKPWLHAHHMTAKCSRCFWKSEIRCHCRQMFASIVSLCSKLFCSLKGVTGQNRNEELIIHVFCHSWFALLQMQQASL